MKPLRWWPVWVLLVLLLLGLTFYFGGRLLPQKYSVTRSTAISAAPEKVFAAIENPRIWRQWAVWPRRAGDKPVYHYGRATGGGAGIGWISPTEGTTVIEVAAVEAPRRVAFAMTRPDVGASASSEFKLDSRGPRTQVNWVMLGDVGRDPWHRWMALFAAPMLAHEMEDSLERLKTYVEAN